MHQPRRRVFPLRERATARLRERRWFPVRLLFRNAKHPRHACPAEFDGLGTRRQRQVVQAQVRQRLEARRRHRIRRLLRQVAAGQARRGRAAGRHGLHRRRLRPSQGTRPQVQRGGEEERQGRHPGEDKLVDRGRSLDHARPHYADRVRQDDRQRRVRSPAT